MYVPDQGDFVVMDFELNAGKEISKRRPGCVLSKKVFNKKTSMVIVCPIKTRSRHTAMDVEVPPGLKLQGFALVDQLKAVDYQARNIVFVDKAPMRFMKQIEHIAHLITQV